MSQPKVVKLAEPLLDNDCDFIQSMVHSLGMAREGKVTGYALVFRVEDEGGVRDVTASRALLDEDRYQVLGMIEKLKHDFMRTAWPED